MFKCAMCDQFHNNGVKVIYNGAEVLVCKECFKEYWLVNYPDVERTGHES